MPLPTACDGCPLASQRGQFVPNNFKDGAPVLVVTDTPSPDGTESRYAKQMRMPHEAVNLTSAIRCTGVLPKRQSSQATKAGKSGPAEEIIERCWATYGRVPGGTKLIVSRGDDALWAVSGLSTSSSWRGWVVPQRGYDKSWLTQVWHPKLTDVSVLVTAPSADLMAQTLDWRKVERILKGVWPVPFPGYDAESPAEWPNHSAFDTEFTFDTGELTRYSLFDGQGLPWVIEAPDVRLVPVPDNVNPLVFLHNEGADIGFLRRVLGEATKRLRIEDTMYMSACLWCDTPNDLEYLASLYGRLNRSKHLGWESKEYSAADAIITWDVGAQLMREMQADPLSYKDYREGMYPLTPIIQEAQDTGLQLRQDRVQEALAYYQARQDETTAEAQAYVGWPINLGSPEMLQRWLYEIEGIGQKKRGKR